jgi:hypothetical protein
MFLGK